MYVAERICSRRKRSLIRRGLVPGVRASASSDPDPVRPYSHLVTSRMGDRPIRFSSTSIREKPMPSPSNGELSNGTRTLNAKLPHCTESSPAAATAEPMSPPISAWLLELGMARAQVMRFQAIAPTRAAVRTVAPLPRTVLSWTMPDPIVPATAVPKTSAPTKLDVADRRIACSGLSARVATDVAIALAVSWKPLM